MSAQIKTFYDENTHTLTYLVWQGADAVLIDPVHDYNPVGSTLSYSGAEKISEFIEEKELNLRFVMETHAHADHLSGAPYFKDRFDAKVVIGEQITAVQDIFKDVFAMDDLAVDGSQFDVLLKDNEVLQAGALKIRAIHTPGHTPACMTYQIDDALFVGDALFMPDSGVGRCDFPKGDASALYNSVHNKLYEFGDEMRVFVGHDYQPDGREVAWKTTVGESKAKNTLLPWEMTEEDFVQNRKARDKTLAAPKLLFQSVQVNINAGELPQDGFLKIPLRSD